jgi:tight adherence protein C
MTALALGVAWAVVVAVVVGERRAPARLPAPEPTAAQPPPAALVGTDVMGAGHRGTTLLLVPAAGSPAGRDPDLRVALRLPVVALGGWLRRGARRPPDLDADRRVGWATLAAVALVPLAPPLAALPLAWAGLSPSLAARRTRRAREAAVTDQLPDVVDLLALTTAAGLPIAAALCAIGRRPGGPMGAALDHAAALIERGGTTADALDLILERVGPSTRSLVDTLAAHDRYGTPLAPALERVGIESRLRRRRQAEEAARRLPVTLLFPLVLTTLPAFALLTVVPLLAGSFGSLSP